MVLRTNVAVFKIIIGSIMTCAIAIMIIINITTTTVRHDFRLT